MAKDNATVAQEIDTKAKGADKAASDKANGVIVGQSLIKQFGEAFASASSAGSFALEEIAREFGRSASVAGRPTNAAWLAFVGAMASQTKAEGESGPAGLSHEARLRLVRIAMAEHKTAHGSNAKFKPCATQKAKGGLGKGSSTWVLNSPVAVTIAAE